MPTVRALSTVMELPSNDMGPNLTTRGARMQVDLDPFLNLDLFAMTGPVFSPHPHAGFSAASRSPSMPPTGAWS